jgi:LysR family transcriptional regulator, cyn operon transcriptional activator
MAEPDLRHIRAFVAVVEAQGLARAGHRLHLSQPTLSRQIQALERSLGVRLFHRTRRGVQLTSQGEDLLVRSRRLLADVHSLRERARALEGGQAGVLRVGATPQMIEGLLAGFLPSYRRRHPGVEVLLVEDGGASLPGRLERDQVDLAVTAAGDRRFEQRLLRPPICLLVAVSRAHRLARRAVVEIGELAESSLLLLRREFGSRVWFDAACQVANIRPRVLLESGAPHTLMALARDGYGVAVLPSTVEIPRRDLRVVPLTLRGVPVGGWVALAWDPRRFFPPYAEQFVAELAVHSRRAHANREVIREVTRRMPRLPPP